MNTKQPSIRSGQRLPYFNPQTDRPNSQSCEDMNLIVAVCNAVLNCRQWRISENGIAFIPGAVTGGIVFRGEWSSSVSDYKTNDLVFISTGPAAGSAIATQNVPAGTSPEMGAPYWVYFPVPPPGNWST